VTGEPKLRGVYETVLYAQHLPAAAQFYRDVLGLAPIDDADGLYAGFRLPDGGVLLLFAPGRSAEPGRLVPSHGTTGAGHVAFSTGAGELERWRARLNELGVEVERELGWDEGGRSLYVRDPAGNSVELVDGEIWA
jgi:catechol 2,3-dioxygenase-like lactoylglutathione lyase family enzyme